MNTTAQGTEYVRPHYEPAYRNALEHGKQAAIDAIIRALVKSK
jgi:hypothetical protein